jgi:hypothetical protein
LHVSGDDATPNVDASIIRLALAQLRARNAHHQFEDLCRDFFRARISPDVLPATGPVGAGGDQGRDFETFSPLTGRPKSDRQIVGMCTLQVTDLAEKIRRDLGKVAADEDVDRAYVFCESDMAVAVRHGLTKYADTRYGIKLWIFDGNGLAEQLAAPDMIAIAARYLSLPPEVLRRGGLETAEAHDWARRVCIGFPRPELHRYLRAVERAAQEHPYGFTSGLSRARMPALAEVYCPQDLVDLSASRGGQPGNAGPPDVPSWVGLLGRHRHLLVRGGPGAGKSTLLRHIATALAHDALAGHPADYLPVLFHARDLAAGQPLADAIHEGATRFLHTALVRGLPRGIFDSAPLPGVGWLVLIDGLDEIRDHEAREAALRTMRDGLDEPAWRFLAATRPLPEEDFRELRPRFGECELRPFTGDELKRFAIRWLSKVVDHDAEGMATRIQEHVQLIGSDGVTASPLAAAMLCMLVTHAPAEPLPAGRISLYTKFINVLQAHVRPASDPAVRALQEQCLTMLEDLSFQRHCGDWEEPILAAAVQWAQDGGLHCAPGMVNWWERVVHDVLCETGLVVPAVDGLEFSHPTFEDFLAARYMYRKLGQRAGELQLRQSLSELLEQVSSPYDSRDDFFYCSDSFRFLVGMWTAGQHDSDWFTAELLDATSAASNLIADLMADGIPLGEKVTAALERIGSDWREEDNHRISSANALTALDAARGVALLLAVTVDLDMDEFERLKITRSLATSSPPVAAAIRWLTCEAYWNSLDVLYKAEAIHEVTRPRLDESAVLQGLEIIATNPHLDGRHRVSAAADIGQIDRDAGQRLLKSLMRVPRLALHLADAANRGSEAALTSLWYLIRDTSLAVADRFDAADMLASVDLDACAEAFQDLSSDQTLTIEQRSKAAAEAAALTRHPY